MHKNLKTSTLNLGMLNIAYLNGGTKKANKTSGGVVDDGYFHFKDPEVERICIENWSSDGVGCTLEDIQAVTNIGTKFRQNSEITSFDEFEKFTGVTALGVTNNRNYAPFMACTNLKSVVLPVNAAKLYRSSFEGCSLLENFVVDWSKISIIETETFKNCTSLVIEDLSLPNLETLGQNALYGVSIKKISNLGKITALPDALSSTQNFGNKAILEEVNIPSTVTVLPRYSFYGYSALKKISSLENIISIGTYAFQGTIVEGDVVMPNLTEIWTRAFTGTKISSFSAAILETIPSADGGRGVFQGNTNLTQINLPSVTSIGSYAFKDCAISGELTLQSVQTINDSAFSNNNLEKLFLPNIVNLVGASNANGTFAKNIQLKHVDFGESIEGLMRDEFYGCTNLEIVICRATTPPAWNYGDPFRESNSTFLIYVPDASVEAYKEASGWVDYADRIKPLSEYVE